MAAVEFGPEVTPPHGVRSSSKEAGDVHTVPIALRLNRPRSQSVNTDERLHPLVLSTFRPPTTEGRPAPPPKWVRPSSVVLDGAGEGTTVTKVAYLSREALLEQWALPLGAVAKRGHRTGGRSDNVNSRGIDGGSGTELFFPPWSGDGGKSYSGHQQHSPQLRGPAPIVRTGSDGAQAREVRKAPSRPSSPQVPAVYQSGTLLWTPGRSQQDAPRPSTLPHGTMPPFSFDAEPEVGNHNLTRSVSLPIGLRLKPSTATEIPVLPILTSPLPLSPPFPIPPAMRSTTSTTPTGSEADLNPSFRQSPRLRRIVSDAASAAQRQPPLAMFSLTSSASSLTTPRGDIAAPPAGVLPRAKANSLPRQSVSSVSMMAAAPTGNWRPASLTAVGPMSRSTDAIVMSRSEHSASGYTCITVTKQGIHWEQPIFTTKAHVFQIDPSTKKKWLPASTQAINVSYYYDSTRNSYRIISVEGSKAVINSTILPTMQFTKTSQKFGQWTDPRANTVYGLGFASELELAKFIDKFQEVKELTRQATTKTPTTNGDSNDHGPASPDTTTNNSPINKPITISNLPVADAVLNERRNSGSTPATSTQGGQEGHLKYENDRLKIALAQRHARPVTDLGLNYQEFED